MIGADDAFRNIIMTMPRPLGAMTFPKAIDKDEIDRIINAPAGSPIIIEDPVLTTFGWPKFLPNKSFEDLPKAPSKPQVEGNKLTPIEKRRQAEGRPLDDWQHD